MAFLSKVTLKRSGVGSTEYADALRGGYSSHQLIWSLFSDHYQRQRDFLFRWENEPSAHALVVSQRRPEPTTLFEVQTKEYAPKLVLGGHYEFALRANTVVKRRQDGRQTRHDIVWAAKDSGDERPDHEIALDVGGKWLTTRGEEYGFRPLSHLLRINEHNTRTFRKPKGNKVTLSTLDFAGVLEVTNQEECLKGLLEGLGPAKAYGCGLLLLKRL